MEEDLGERIILNDVSVSDWILLSNQIQFVSGVIMSCSSF